MTPAIVIFRKPSPVKKPATAIGPVVFLPADFPPHLKAHELTHVRWWWCVNTIAVALLLLLIFTSDFPYYAAAVLGLGAYAMLYRFLPEFRFRAEAAAYAQATMIAPAEMRRFTLALSTEYGLDKTRDECRIAIQKAMTKRK